MKTIWLINDFCSRLVYSGKAPRKSQEQLKSVLNADDAIHQQALSLLADLEGVKQRDIRYLSREIKNKAFTLFDETKAILDARPKREMVIPTIAAILPGTRTLG